MWSTDGHFFFNNVQIVDWCYKVWGTLTCLIHLTRHQKRWETSTSLECTLHTRRKSFPQTVLLDLGPQIRRKKVEKESTHIFEVTEWTIAAAEEMKAMWNRLHSNDDSHISSSFKEFRWEGYYSCVSRITLSVHRDYVPRMVAPVLWQSLQLLLMLKWYYRKVFVFSSSTVAIVTKPSSICAPKNARCLNNIEVHSRCT